LYLGVGVGAGAGAVCYVFDIIRQGNSVVGKWNKQGTIAIAQQYFLN
tara:strand:+ start:339 stop:479 length:141 start_codon:yes stop_codon:yes gene_type:complete